MARDIVEDYPNMDIKDKNLYSPLGFQNLLVNNLRDAVTNASLFYCSSKQYGDAQDIASAWSTYVHVRDLFEEIIQNLVV